MTKLPEHWLRGPIPEIPALLQPVAHALLQARDEVSSLMEGFAEDHLWERPAGVASPGFHLQHMSGVLDRLFTYARGSMLSTEQIQYLSKEEEPPFPGCSIRDLLDAFCSQVDKSLSQLKDIDPSNLSEARTVGRKALPTTVIGLLTHAAEHTMRHTGQLLVTVRILNGEKNF